MTKNSFVAEVTFKPGWPVMVNHAKLNFRGECFVWKDY